MDCGPYRRNRRVGGCVSGVLSSLRASARRVWVQGETRREWPGAKRTAAAPGAIQHESQAQDERLHAWPGAIPEPGAWLRALQEQAFWFRESQARGARCCVPRAPAGLRGFQATVLRLRGSLVLVWLCGETQARGAWWRGSPARRGLRDGLQLQAGLCASRVQDGLRCELQDATRGAIQDGLRGGTPEPGGTRAGLLDGTQSRGGIRAARRGETQALRGFQGEPERHGSQGELRIGFQVWFRVWELDGIRDVRWIATQARCGSQAAQRRWCGSWPADGRRRVCGDGRRWPWRKQCGQREQRRCAAAGRQWPRCGARSRRGALPRWPGAGCRRVRRCKRRGCC